MKKILKHFKAQKKVIITNRNYEFALLALKALGIYKYFEDVVGGDDIGCAKPSPCPLDKIIHSLNMDKGKTIIVGDMDIDILVGKKEDIIKVKPDFIIDDIMKLKDIMS